MPAAVLFDLDDTLFDHRFSARAGLLHWQAELPVLGAVPYDTLEKTYSDILESVHLELLAGTIQLADARVKRTRALFEHFGAPIERPEAEALYVGYRAAYDAARRMVPGAEALLAALQNAGPKLGIITNNLVSEQIPKLEVLGLADMFDPVVISEGEGVSKPDPRIFEIALERLGTTPAETVMVGDSLTSDIESAERLGMRTVWLDHDARRVEGPPQRRVLSSLLPHEEALAAVLGRS